MINRTRTKSATILGLTAAAVVAFAGGCVGQGAHTREGRNLAETRMAQLKSMSEFDMGNRAFLAGDLKKALGHVEASMGINGQVVSTHVLRGRILLEMGSLDESLTALQLAEALDPSAVEPHYYQGIVFERILQRDRALEKYMLAAELDETNAQYAVAVAEVMMDLGQVEGARKYLAARSSAFEHSAGVKQTLGHISMMSGDAAAAVNYFSQARLLNPDATSIAEDLVHAQMDKGAYAEAEYLLSGLLEGVDAEARRDLRHLRAHCLLKTDRTLEARGVLLGLTQGAAGANDIQAWVGLGTVAVQLRDFNRVRQAASRAQAIAPDRAEGYLLQAVWQSRADKPLQAVRSTAEALRRDRTNMNALTLHAALLTRLQRYDLAERTIEYGRSIDPNSRGLAAVSMALSAHREGGFASVPTD